MRSPTAEPWPAPAPTLTWSSTRAFVNVTVPTDAWEKSGCSRIHAAGVVVGHVCDHHSAVKYAGEHVGGPTESSASETSMAPPADPSIPPPSMMIWRVDFTTEFFGSTHRCPAATSKPPPE